MASVHNLCLVLFNLLIKQCDICTHGRLLCRLSERHSLQRSMTIWGEHETEHSVWQGHELWTWWGGANVHLRGAHDTCDQTRDGEEDKEQDSMVERLWSLDLTVLLLIFWPWSHSFPFVCLCVWDRDYIRWWTAALINQANSSVYFPFAILTILPYDPLMSLYWRQMEKDGIWRKSEMWPHQ